MSNPIVSVVLCTYNGQAFVSEQLDTIIRQTYQQLEIIIVDDCSTDGTFSILKEYAARDNRVQLFSNEVNLGYSANFNKACKLATGKVIAISDQDDLWHLQKIQKLMNAWPDSSPLIYCDSQRFTHGAASAQEQTDSPASSQRFTENSVSWNITPKKKYRRFEGTAVRKLAVFNTISGHALLFRKELLPSIFPVEPGVYYDWKAGVLAAAAGGVTYLPETLVLQRVHLQNISINAGVDLKSPENRTRFKQMVIAHLDVFEKFAGLQQEDVTFFHTLSGLLRASLSSKFSWPLFFFLLNNGTQIFWHKKKPFPFMTHFKYAMKLAGS